MKNVKYIITSVLFLALSSEVIAQNIPSASVSESIKNSDTRPLPGREPQLKVMESNLKPEEQNTTSDNSADIPQPAKTATANKKTEKQTDKAVPKK